MGIFLKPNNPENRSILIWDPFSGTGTTGAIAAQFGVKFFGIEKFKDPFKLAFNRIDKAYQDREEYFAEKSIPPIRARITFTQHSGKSSSSSSSSSAKTQTWVIPESEEKKDIEEEEEEEEEGEEEGEEMEE